MKLFIPLSLILSLALTSPLLAHEQVTPINSAKLIDPPKRSLLNRIFRSKWAGVDPLLREKLEPVLKQLKSEGYDMRLVEGLRSPKRQRELLASGTGVTGVGAGRSCHNWGLAVDSAVFLNGQPSWDLNNPKVSSGYKRYGELAKLAGLNWGGDWKDPVDMPHVELKTDCRLAVRHQKRVERTGEFAYAYEDHPDVHTYAVLMEEPIVQIALLDEYVPQPQTQLCLTFGVCQSNITLAYTIPWSWEPTYFISKLPTEDVQVPACSPNPWLTQTWSVLG